jgi:hypothetical protein
MNFTNLINEEIEQLIESYKRQYKQENCFVMIMKTIPDIEWEISLKQTKKLKSLLTFEEIQLNPHFKSKKMKGKIYSSEKLISWLNAIHNLGFGFKDFTFLKFFSFKKIFKKKRKISQVQTDISSLTTIELETLEG